MTDLKNVSLDDLVGEHMLDAVDMLTERVKQYGDHYEDASLIRFRLDNVVYTAIEDPSDGYRSSMDRLYASPSEPMRNVFPPVKVVGRKRADDTWSKNDTLELFDPETGKIIVEVGTDNTDDYYPSFVSSFHPENMAANQVALKD